MWIFTEIGFFSIVRTEEVEDGEPVMMVRARARADLEQLGQKYGFADELFEILEWPGRDYPYRVLMSQSDVARVLSQLGADIRYPNFKGRIAAVQGAMRAHVYGAVWSTMLGLERKLGITLPRNLSAYE